MIKVLVTGAGALLGQGIIRALRASPLAVRIVAVDPFPLSSGLFWADESYIVPLANDPSYRSRLGELLDRVRPDILLVGTDVELPFFADHQSEIEALHQVKVLVSDSKVISIADDKFRTFEFFRDAGFAAPLSAVPENVDGIADLIEEVGFPLIVKPRIGARAVGVSIVNNREELDAATNGRNNLVIQECVGSTDQEFTASAIVFEGRALASIVMRRDLRDGNTYRAYSEEFEDLNKIVRRWGEALCPYGPANFQFRIDKEGEPKVFEINARFSGTTPLRAMVGFNEVEMCIRKILLGESIIQPTIESAYILRHWSEAKITHKQIADLS
jgi:carbamoyl-phosphate synthase large subunit